MRELRKRHQPHRLSSTDTLLLLRLDESGADTDHFVDATGGAALTQTGAPRRFGPLFSIPPTGPIASGSGSRAFSSSDYGTRAGDAPSRTALLSSALTVEAWIYIDTLAGTDHTIICYGGNGSAQALNYLLWFGVTSTGRLRYEWERNASTLHSGESASGVIVEDRVHHVALVRSPPASGSSSECNVSLFVDGVRVSEFTDESLPNGGTDASVSWRVGADMAASRQAFARFDDIRVSKFSATEECIRDSFARARQTFDDATVWSHGGSTHYRVLVDPAASGDWFDLTDIRGVNYVLDVTTSDSADAQTMTASVTLRLAFSHLLTSSPFAAMSLHLQGDAEVPSAASRIKIETATLPRGASREAVGIMWRPLMSGMVTKVDVDDKVTLTVEDDGVELRKTFIQPDRSGPSPVDFSYGSDVGSAIEQEIVKIIDDQEPSAGWRAGSHALFVPSSPSWNVYPFNTPPTMNVSQQIEDLAGSIGWLCRRRFDDHRVAMLLTLYEPNRSATWTSDDLALSSSDVIDDVEKLAISDEDVRNKIEVEYGDSSDKDATGTIKRKSVVVSDATSIAKYGERYARIALGSTQRINNSSDATKLANAVLSDLKDPVADVRVTIPYRYHVDVGDMVRLLDDDRRVAFNGSIDCAVYSVEHTLSVDGGHRTTLALRQAKPVGRVARWLATFVSEWGTVSSDGLAPPTAPTSFTATALAGATWLQWAYPTNWRNRRYDVTEVHASLSSGFTPSSSTLKALVRGNSIALGKQNGLDGTHYYKIVHRDRSGNRSAVSSQVSAVPLTALPSYRFRAVATGGFSTNYNTTPQQIESGLTTTEEYDVGGAFATSPWVFTAPVGGLYSFTSLIIVSSSSTSCRAFLYVDSGSGYVERARGIIGSFESLVTASLLLNAGDLVTIYITADATGRRLQSNTFFEGRYVMP